MRLPARYDGAMSPGKLSPQVFRGRALMGIGWDQTMGVYFEDVTVRMQVTPFERDTHLEEWNGFAAVNDEFVPIHMDDTGGRAAGTSEARSEWGI
jgi:hypothetical protein